MTIKNRLSQIETESSFQVINRSELVTFLTELRGGCFTFGSVILLTDVEMKKKGNPFANYKVQKLSKWSFGANSSYQTRVSNERERQGLSVDFTPRESWWESLTGNPKCAVGCHKVHRDQFYGNFYPNSDQVSFVEYYLEGVKATDFQAEQIKSVMKKKGVEGKSQGLSEENAVLLRRPKLESIAYIIADGRKLKIID